LQVSVDGARFRELEDFYPDRLFRNLKLFREFDPAENRRAQRAETQILVLIDLGLQPLFSLRDSNCVRLAGFRAIKGDKLALRSA